MIVKFLTNELQKNFFKNGKIKGKEEKKPRNAGIRIKSCIFLCLTFN